MLRTTMSELNEKVNYVFCEMEKGGDDDNDAYPKTMQNGKISNNTDALIGKCFSSRVIASEAKEKARLSNVN